MAAEDPIAETSKREALRKAQERVMEGIRKAGQMAGDAYNRFRNPPPVAPEPPPVAAEAAPASPKPSVRTANAGPYDSVAEAKKRAADRLAQARAQAEAARGGASAASAAAPEAAAAKTGIREAVSKMVTPKTALGRAGMVGAAGVGGYALGDLAMQNLASPSMREQVGRGVAYLASEIPGDPFGAEEAMQNEAYARRSGTWVDASQTPPPPAPPPAGGNGNIVDLNLPVATETAPVIPRAEAQPVAQPEAAAAPMVHSVRGAQGGTADVTYTPRNQGMDIPIEQYQLEALQRGGALREGQGAENITPEMLQQRGSPLGLSYETMAQANKRIAEGRIGDGAGTMSTLSFAGAMDAERKRQEEEARTAIPNRIKEIQAELRAPTRGLRQSLSDIVEENQRRSALRSELDVLVGQQKQESAERMEMARQDRMDRRAEFEAGSRMGIAAGKAAALAEKNRSTEEKKAYKDFTDSALSFAEKYYPTTGDKATPDNAYMQQLYVAQTLDQSNPEGYKYDDTYGLATRRFAKRKLWEAIKDEQGIYDMINNRLFGGRGFSQKDVENMNFTEVDVGKGRMVLVPELISPNDVLQVGDTNAYAYLDNMDPKLAYAIRRIAEIDRKDVTGKTPQKLSIRSMSYNDGDGMDSEDTGDFDY